MIVPARVLLKIFFFKQKTAYGIPKRDWSSDVCSSDLDTPNIHLCTVADFDDLCRERGWRVLRRSLLDHERHDDWLTRPAPTLLAESALYMLRGKTGGWPRRS